MGYFFCMAYSKMKKVLEQGDSKRNDLGKLDSALNNIKVAYVLAFIAAGLSLLLSLLYAGHESVISPSEYWHLALFLITYALLVISVIYAFMVLNKLYDLRIEDRNGADSYIWAGLFVALFGFLGLTASSSGRLGMNIARGGASKRLQAAESKVNEHLPAIRSHIESVRNSVENDMPVIRSKVDQLHQSNLMSSPVLGDPLVIPSSRLSQPLPQVSQPQPMGSSCQNCSKGAVSPSLPSFRRV